MQTSVPGASGERKLRPWQFSLRSLLQFYVLLVLAAGVGFPKGWRLARGIGASAVLAAYFVFGGRYLSPPNRSAHVVLLSASWLSWPSLAVMGWLIRRAVSVEDRQAIRRVSVMHLTAEVAALTFVVVAASLQGIEILWYTDDGLWLVAFMANSIPLVLWLSLLSPWRNVPWAWPDSIFRWSMIVALGIAIPSCLAMLYLSQNRERLNEYYSSRGEYTLFWFEITAVLVFSLPQMVSAALFVAAVTCQLFRGHQDRWLIALGCVYFIPFWLTLLAFPRFFASQ